MLVDTLDVHTDVRAHSHVSAVVARCDSASRHGPLCDTAWYVNAHTNAASHKRTN
jgi:hypothetical protein